MSIGDFEGVVDSNLIQEESFEKKPKEEEREPKLGGNEHFILAIIAESDEESVDALFVSYKKQYPGAIKVVVKSILNKLDKNELIRHTGNIGGNRLYRATDKGIEVVKKNSRILEKYKKAIDEHIEMSKKANEF